MKKKRRRGNGEGTIFEDKKNKRWIGQYISGIAEDGKAIRKSVYGKSDALSVIEKVYEKSRKKENVDLRYLDSFIKYVKVLTKQQEENLTQNIGKSIVSELSEVEKMDRLTGVFQREAREFNNINDEIEQE